MNAIEVSYLLTKYLGPYLLRILDPVECETMYSSGGKKSSRACSARANPSGSRMAMRASGPRLRSPGGGGGGLRGAQVRCRSESQLGRSVRPPASQLGGEEGEAFRGQVAYALQSQTTLGSRQSMDFKNVWNPSDESLDGQKPATWWKTHEMTICGATRGEKRGRSDEVVAKRKMKCV